MQEKGLQGGQAGGPQGGDLKSRMERAETSCAGRAGQLWILACSSAFPLWIKILNTGDGVNRCFCSRIHWRYWKFWAFGRIWKKLPWHGAHCWSYDYQQSVSVLRPFYEMWAILHFGIFHSQTGESFSCPISERECFVFQFCLHRKRRMAERFGSWRLTTAKINSESHFSLFFNPFSITAQGANTEFNSYL